MTKYEWKKVWDCGSKENDGSFSGHTVFLDELSNRFAIADMSGDTPDATDDGVLWLDFDREIRLFLSDFSNNVLANMPLKTVDGTQTFTMCATPKLPKLIDYLLFEGVPSVKVVASKEVLELRENLSNLLNDIDELTNVS
jgi:hypothetical protein